MTQPNQIVDNEDGTFTVHILDPYEPPDGKHDSKAYKMLVSEEVEELQLGRIYVRHIIACDGLGPNETVVQLISELSGVPRRTIMRMSESDYQACATAIGQLRGKSRATGRTPSTSSLADTDGAPQS